MTKRIIKIQDGSIVLLRITISGKTKVMVDTALTKLTASLFNENGAGYFLKEEILKPSELPQSNSDL